MKDYEIDYDDDGNEIKVPITKAVLKARLKATEERYKTLYGNYARASEENRSLERKLKNAEWGQRLVAALGDGQVFATDLRVETKTDYIDVTSDYDTFAVAMPGRASVFLHVTFTGDEGVIRLGKFLKEEG